LASPSFHGEVALATSVQDVLDAVVASAIGVLGDGFYGMIYQGVRAEGDANDDAWLVCQYNAQARPIRSQFIDPPPHTPHLREIDITQPLAMSLMGILPWVADYLCDADDLRAVRMLPLQCHGPAAAVLLHDRPTLPAQPQLEALIYSWGTAVVGMARHEAARRLGEELAEVNRVLTATQDELLKAASMSRLGEMAAGAAHEMNNPLAVISGRSQMLAMSLSPGSEPHKAAQTICHQAQRLSNLITSLRLFADPPEPQRRPTDIASLLDETVRSVRLGLNRREADAVIDLQVKSGLPPLRIDPEQVADALREIIRNAMQSQPKQSVLVSARVDPQHQRLLIQVSDDGVGMDEHTLAHATDPFFSAKSAGRRVGMGLTRAQQLVKQHRGTLGIRSTLGRGTVVTMSLPLDVPY